jgi:hypothetical protein
MRKIKPKSLVRQPKVLKFFGTGYPGKKWPNSRRLLMK